MLLRVFFKFGYISKKIKRRLIPVFKKLHD